MRFHCKPKALAIMLALLFLGGCGIASAEPPMPGAKIIPPQFQSVLPQLQQQTQIPVVLPTYVPGDFRNTPEQSFYPSLSSVTGPDYYEISVDSTPDCNGGTHCYFGILTGERLYQSTLSVPEQYAFELSPDFQPGARSPEAQQEVRLARGITGYFVPYICGASCDTSKVFWEQNGDRYSVRIRMASKATMVQMANSAILNER